MVKIPNVKIPNSGKLPLPPSPAKLGESCPKVMLSQDRMPIVPLTQQQSWERGKRAFLSSPAKLEEGGKGPFPLRQLSLGRGKRPFSPPLSWVGEGRKAFLPLTKMCCWVSDCIGILS